MARYYRMYADLMAHWRAALPEADFMLEVDYDALVEDFAPQVRRILDFCGLEWDENCLNFHENPRVVLTASNAQVRRPIYRESLRRAAAYGELLAPFRAALA